MLLQEAPQNVSTAINLALSGTGCTPGRLATVAS